MLRTAIPISTSTAERSFSSLRWLKPLHRLHRTIRSTITQQRLKHLAVQNVHNKMADAVNLISIADKFISRAEICRATFAVRTWAEFHFFSQLGNSVTPLFRPCHCCSPPYRVEREPPSFFPVSTVRSAVFLLRGIQLSWHLHSPSHSFSLLGISVTPLFRVWTDWICTFNGILFILFY